jgi:hypothetical protein
MKPLEAVADPLAIFRDPVNSSHREQLVEYAVLSELLQDGWLRRGQRMDVLRADVDAAGYDVVLQCQRVMRHIQLKSTVLGGKTQEQKVHTALAEHASGCVVWVVLNPGEKWRARLEYLVFGGAPGTALQGLDSFPVATHTKGNAQGFKAERPHIRVVPKSAFTRLSSTAALSDWLFGPPLGGGSTAKE